MGKPGRFAPPPPRAREASAPASPVAACQAAGAEPEQPAEHTFLVGLEFRGMRLDAFLSQATGLSRARLKKAVQQGQCRVDGTTRAEADLRLAPGQTIRLDLPVEHTALLPEQGDLVVLYRDEHLAVLDKPAGLTVHPCPSCPEGTLVHRLLAYFPELALQPGFRPGIVHRLDKDTSGLLVVALTEPARLALTEAFAARTVHKTYLALTQGTPVPTGSMDSPLGRHPTLKTKRAVVPENKGGRPALTEWQTLYTDPGARFALLAVTISTGRTHQIRVHLAEAGHPLWGDKLYAPRHVPSPALRQMLHAWKLDFAHPFTGEPMAFTCPPPPDFVLAMLALSRRMQRVIITGAPGCGKSTVLRLLRDQGLPAWSADEAVAELYQPGFDGWRLIRQRFGDSFFSGPTRNLDRAALTLALTRQPGLRQELEALIHPLVSASMERFFLRAESGGKSLAFAEVPLWHESRLSMPGPSPVVVTVACSSDVRHSRLKQSRGWSDEKTAAVESWQWPQADKIKASHFALENEGDEAALAARCQNLLTHLEALRQIREKSLSSAWTSIFADDSSGGQA